MVASQYPLEKGRRPSFYQLAGSRRILPFMRALLSPFWTSYFLRVLPFVWGLSLLLVLFTLATPLEFVPLAWGNLPRWMLWGTALPACRQLWLRTSNFRWVWRSAPWVLWLLLLAAELLAVWGWFCGSHRVTFWKTVRYPLEMVFANRDYWETQRILFRRGPRVLVHQLCWNPQHGVVDLRQVKVVPLLPGLQWASRVSTHFQPGVVEASWRLVDTVGAKMSQDTALQRRVKPWLLKYEESKKL